MGDLLFCAHYPFSQEAREEVRSRGLAINAALIAKGEERLRKALGSEGAIKLLGSGLEAELIDEIGSYAASRMILAAWKNRYAMRRMAVAESKRAHEYLKDAEERRRYAGKVAQELGLAFTQVEKTENNALMGRDGPLRSNRAEGEEAYLLPFWQYLASAPRDIHYKLTNTDLKGGLVRLSTHQRGRLMEEAIRIRLENGPFPDLKEPPAEIKAAIQRLEALLPRENLAPTHIDQKDFPPCIRKMLIDLGASVNIPHSGRLALAIYLIKAGLSDEQICSLFTTAPDYNKDTTGYQVRYIRQKGYSMPSCTTMDTYGLCLAKCNCRNPANYRQGAHERNARASMDPALAESVFRGGTDARLEAQKESRPPAAGTAGGANAAGAAGAGPSPTSPASGGAPRTGEERKPAADDEPSDEYDGEEGNNPLDAKRESQQEDD